MKKLLTFAAALTLIGSTARADEAKQQADHESATAAAKEALAEKAETPKAPGTLPDEASATAKERSHGKRGAAMKKLHSESREADRADKDAKADAKQAADHDRDDAANKSARGASDKAARDANGDAHSAAGQARANQKRNSASDRTRR